MEQVTASSNARAVLGQVSRELKRFLALQRAQGIDGVVAAPLQERQAWEAQVQEAQARRVERMRAQLIEGGAAAAAPKPAAPSFAPSAAPSVEREAPSQLSAQVQQASQDVKAKTPPPISSADEPAPWKTFGRRPQLLVDPAKAAAAQPAARPQPSTPPPREEARHRAPEPTPPQQPPHHQEPPRHEQPRVEQGPPRRDVERSSTPPQQAPKPRPPQAQQPQPQRREQIPDAPPRAMNAATPRQSAEEEPSSWQGRRSGDLFTPAAVETIRGFNDTSELQTRLDQMNRREKIGFLRECLGDCQRCGLSKSRTNIVFGEGSPNAELVFVGEAPGYHEDVQGLPFVGDSGQLLDRMIEAMGLQRELVYICNVLKCRPPKNRNPAPEEIQRCSPFLYKQLEAINPRAIVTLGRFAGQCLLQTDSSMTRMRGRWHDWRGVPVMPTFHPSYLLRQPDEKRKAWEDLQKVMKMMGLQGKR